MIYRYDSGLYTNKEIALKLDKLWSNREKEYNTTMKVEGGYVVTNKFDPRCNDKVTPVIPDFTNREGRSS